MKNLKKWLIKKLGGYTEQYTTRPRIVKIDKEEFKVQDIKVELMHPIPMYEEEVRTALSAEIAKRLKDVMVIQPSVTRTGNVSYFTSLSFIAKEPSSEDASSNSLYRKEGVGII